MRLAATVNEMLEVTPVAILFSTRVYFLRENNTRLTTLIVEEL